jgi:hypothetical protein
MKTPAKRWENLQGPQRFEAGKNLAADLLRADYAKDPTKISYSNKD